MGALLPLVITQLLFLLPDLHSFPKQHVAVNSIQKYQLLCDDYPKRLKLCT